MDAVVWDIIESKHLFFYDIKEVKNHIKDFWLDGKQYGKCRFHLDVVKE